MLSQEDRRRLDAIERQLQLSDPDLAHLLIHWPEPTRRRWALIAAIMIIVLGTIGVLGSMLLRSPLLVVLSGLMTLAGWMWVYLHRSARSRVR